MRHSHLTRNIKPEGQCPECDLRRGPWVKSSLSSYAGNCVEVAGLGSDTIRVRDSKNPGGSILRFTPAEWDAFLGGARQGEFNLPDSPA